MDVEILSRPNSICAVEFPGHQPIFITKIKEHNKSHWVSIPQGNDELASAVGKHIDEQLHGR